MTWMSTAVVSGSFCDVQSWWLIISTVLVCVSSLAAIRAQWMAFRVVLWSVGNARPMPLHLADCACPRDPNIMSRGCGE